MEKFENADSFSNADVKKLLNDVLGDRLGGEDFSNVEKEIDLINKIEEAEKNLKLLRLLNGQRGQTLRGLVSGSKSGPATYLQGLYEWSILVSKGAVDSEKIEEEVPESLTHILEERNLDEATLTSYIALVEKNPGVGPNNFKEIREEKTRVVGSTIFYLVYAII